MVSELLRQRYSSRFIRSRGFWCVVKFLILDARGQVLLLGADIICSFLRSEYAEIWVGIVGGAILFSCDR